MTGEMCLPLLSDSSQRTNILVLGGTLEARLLAEWLNAQPWPKSWTPPCHVISSLAGRTKTPYLPSGTWRRGGFGGVTGLVDFLKTHHIHLILDATHPFACQISTNAREAARLADIPLLHFERSAWQKQVRDNWIEADDETHAASLLPADARAFLALGRQHLAPFGMRRDVVFFARMIERVEDAQEFSHFTFIQQKPQDAADEQLVFASRRIDMLVCRNSGGLASYGKIVAARALALPVVMIRRPTPPQSDTVTSLQQMQEKILGFLLRRIDKESTPCTEN